MRMLYVFLDRERMMVMLSTTIIMSCYAWFISISIIRLNCVLISLTISCTDKFLSLNIILKWEAGVGYLQRETVRIIFRKLKQVSDWYNIMPLQIRKSIVIMFHKRACTVIIFSCPVNSDFQNENPVSVHFTEK